MTGYNEWRSQFDFLEPADPEEDQRHMEELLRKARMERGQFSSVQFMRWHSMTSASPPKTTAAILILNPSTPEIDIRYKHKLVLRFWDHSRLDLIDGLLARLLGSYPPLCVAVRERLRRDTGWPWRPPLMADAEAIQAFLNQLPDDVDQLHVACEYGRSRSRAVAEWVAKRCGIEAVGNRLKGRPNPRLVWLLNGLKDRPRLASPPSVMRDDLQPGKLKFEVRP